MAPLKILTLADSSLWLDPDAVESFELARDVEEYDVPGSPAVHRRALPTGALALRLKDAAGVRWMTDEQAAEANRV